MDTNKQKFNQMTKVVGMLLKGEYLEKSEMEKVKDDFVNGFYEVLRIALDVNIDDKKFAEFIQSGKKDDAVETARFLIETLDNEKTYTLMNYYLMNFLLAFGKGAKIESRNHIQTIFVAENLNPVGFATVSENYKKLISSSF